MSTPRNRFSGAPLFLVIGSDALRAGKVAQELAHRYAPDYEVAEVASGVAFQFARSADRITWAGDHFVTLLSD